MRRALEAQGRRRALTVLAVVGGLPLLAAVAVVTLIPQAPPAATSPIQAQPAARAGQSAASRSGRAGVPSSSTGSTGTALADPATTIAPDEAAAELQRAGIDVAGEVSRALGWTDDRGRSLLAATREVTERADDGSPTRVNLHVYYLTGLDGNPTLRRRLRDPSLHCDHHATMNADFTSGAFRVGDLDGDGNPEVTVGWTARCGAPTSASRIRFAIISGGSLYVLRADGVVAVPGAQPGAGPDPATAPARSQWPEPFLDAALGAFHRLYY